MDLRWFLFMVIFNTMCLSDRRLTMEDDLAGFEKEKSRPRDVTGAPLNTNAELTTKRVCLSIIHRNYRRLKNREQCIFRFPNTRTLL